MRDPRRAEKTELGKLDVGTTTGSSNTIETNYIKVIIAAETCLLYTSPSPRD